MEAPKTIIETKRKKKKLPLYKLENMAFFMDAGCATKKAIEKFADDCFDYYMTHPDAYYINEYSLSKGVSRKLFTEWTRKNAYFRKRYEMLLEILGLRREKLLQKNNPDVLRLKQYQYDESWGEAEVRLAEIKRPKDSTPPEVNVFFDGIPDNLKKD